MVTTYAVISLALNVVLSLVLWDGNTSNWTPPSGTYAVAVPGGTVVVPGDTYSTSTNTFTAQNVPRPTATPVPVSIIGNCTTAKCFTGSGAGDESGNSLTFLAVDSNGDPLLNSGAGLTLSGTYALNDVGFFVLPRFPYLEVSSVPQYWASLVAVRNSSPTVFEEGSSNVAAGDLLVATGDTIFEPLHKNTTATRYLANTGTSNVPAWDQVNLATGVTGTLPVANGGRGTQIKSRTSDSSGITTAATTGLNSFAIAASTAYAIDGFVEVDLTDADGDPTFYLVASAGSVTGCSARVYVDCSVLGSSPSIGSGEMTAITTDASSGFQCQTSTSDNVIARFSGSIWGCSGTPTLDLRMAATTSDTVLAGSYLKVDQVP